MESLFCCLFPILLAIGIGSVVTADKQDRRRRALRRSGLRAYGRVVGHDDTPVAGRTAFRPIVGFRDNHGAEQRFLMEAASDSTDPPVGTEVPVLYESGQPQNALVDNEESGKRAVKTPMIVGLVCLGLSTLIAVGAIVSLVARIEVH